LHKITRGLPAHQRIFPSVSLAQDVPIHSPVMAAPLAGLCGRFGWLVDAVCFVRMSSLQKGNNGTCDTYRTVLA
jgi:hypothetical protein